MAVMTAGMHASRRLRRPGVPRGLGERQRIHIGTQCNRFRALHLGVSGDPMPGLHYRVKASWQKGWGKYDDPYMEPRENTSLLVEASYRTVDERSFLRPVTLTLGLGADFGKLRGDNKAVQLTVKYQL